jgi:hypothetical protein
MGISESRIFNYKDKDLVHNKKNNKYYWVTFKDKKEIIRIPVNVSIIKRTGTSQNQNIPYLVKFKGDSYWTEMPTIQGPNEYIYYMC